MPSISADNEIDLTRVRMIEAHPHATPLVLDARDGVAEDGLDPSVQSTVDRGRQVGTQEAGVATVEQPADGVRRGAAALAAVSVHEAQLLHLVAQFTYTGDEAHLFGDVIADQPEVDDVPAAAQLWRGLDEHHLMTGFTQPVGERRTGDTHPVDDNPHAHLAGPDIPLSSRAPGCDSLTRRAGTARSNHPKGHLPARPGAAEDLAGRVRPEARPHHGGPASNGSAAATGRARTAHGAAPTARRSPARTPRRAPGNRPARSAPPAAPGARPGRRGCRARTPGAGWGRGRRRTGRRRGTAGGHGSPTRSPAGPACRPGSPGRASRRRASSPGASTAAVTGSAAPPRSLRATGRATPAAGRAGPG